MNFIQLSLQVDPEIERIGDKMLCGINLCYFLYWGAISNSKFIYIFLLRSLGLFTENDIWNYIWNLSYVYPWLVHSSQRNKIIIISFYIFCCMIHYKFKARYTSRALLIPVFAQFMIHNKMTLVYKYEFYIILLASFIHGLLMVTLTYLADKNKPNSLFLYSDTLFVDTFIIYPYLIYCFS